MTTAMDRVRERAARVTDQRARDWATIQAEAPDLAAWLLAMREAFGKPEEVRACWRAYE